MPNDLSLPRSWLRPVFSHPSVRACMTSREGGVSEGPYGCFNPRPGVGDDEACVLENRARLRGWVGRPSRLLEQVHGVDVAVLEDLRDEAAPLSMGPRADACLTLRSDLACEIQVADCLPVLVADRHGRGVAAAHAGWRGLASGVLEATVTALAQRIGCGPGDLEYWLGPCIGPDRFEVGLDVLHAFGSRPEATGPCFRPTGRDGKWWADLAELARQRLMDLGLEEVPGPGRDRSLCTASDAERWFSYRRDRVCGRMSALIWLERGELRS